MWKWIFQFSALPKCWISVITPVYSFAFEKTFYRGMCPGRNGPLVSNRLVQ